MFIGVGFVFLAIVLFITDIAKDLILVILAIAAVTLYFHFFGNS